MYNVLRAFTMTSSGSNETTLQGDTGPGMLRSIREALGDDSVYSFEKLLQLQCLFQESGLSSLPITLVRAICQKLSHADIEQCRLVCKDWRGSFGEASVTDMYLAMCADFSRAQQLATRFTTAYPNFHHLHFWIPGGNVRQMMGTDGGTFQQYMELFSACGIKALTAHYLDDLICPVAGITRLSGLSKLELVDLMPANATLACLKDLPHLRHLIVEYKDGSATPNLESIGELHALTQLELSLHGSFVNGPLLVTLPQSLPPILSSSDEEWALSILAAGKAVSMAGGPLSMADAVSSLSAVAKMIQSLTTTSAASAAARMESESTSSSSAAAALDTVVAAAASGSTSSFAPPLAAEPGPAGYEGSTSGLHKAAEEEVRGADGEGAEALALLERPGCAASSSKGASSSSGKHVLSSERNGHGSWLTSDPVTTTGTCGSLRTSSHHGTSGDSLLQSHVAQLLGFSEQEAGAFGNGPVGDEGEELAGPSGLPLSAGEAVERISSSEACLLLLQGGADQGGKSDFDSTDTGEAVESISSSEAYLLLLQGGADQGGESDFDNMDDVTVGVGEFEGAASSADSPAPDTLHAMSPLRTVAVTVADYMLAQMTVHWRQLRNLQRLELRSAPAGLAQRYPRLFQALPSLTELKMVGLDTRLKEVYGPSQPSFKVEVSRDASSLTMGPATLALSLHCDTSTAARTALQQLTAIATTAAPQSPPFERSQAPAPSTASTFCTPGPGARGASAPAAALVPVTPPAPSGRRAPQPLSPQPWVSTPQSQANSAAQQQLHTPSAAVAAAEERRRQQMLRQHPGLGILEAHSAKLSTLRLYLNNPDFSALKPLSYLRHLQELSLMVCFTTESDSDSESEDEVLGVDLSHEEDDDEVEEEAVPFLSLPFAAPVTAASAAAGAEEEEPLMVQAGGPEDVFAAAGEAVQGPSSCSGSGDPLPDPLSPEVSSSLAVFRHTRFSTFSPATPQPAQTGVGLLDRGSSSPVEDNGSESGSTDVQQPVPVDGSTAAPMTPVVQAAAGPDVAPASPTSPAMGLHGAGLVSAPATPGMSAMSTPVAGPDPHVNSWHQAASTSLSTAAATAPAAQSGTAPATAPALHPRHIISALRALSCRRSAATALTHLTVREEIPANTSNEDGLSASHETCSLGPEGIEMLARRLHHLVHLEWQGLIVSPHPSSLSPLTGLVSLRSLTLAVNQDDPVSRLGLHCLPSLLTSLTLQNISVAPSPLGSSVSLPSLCHLHLKSCALPDLPTFSVAPAVEWLSLDNCDAAVYAPDLVLLWPGLSWLEVTYTHQDWRLFHSADDLVSLSRLSRLRKLSLVTPYEEQLTIDGLLALTQLRLLSISPTPSMGRYEHLMRLSEFRFLAGLEIKLYSDVPHHEQLVDVAGSMHADMQEGLPMTDVLIMVDDSYADDPSGV